MAVHTVRAPRGSALTTRGWPQEAALRMLMNNLDPDVAERPQDLVVYGGTGKAARNWGSFEAITRELTALRERDEHPPRRLLSNGKGPILARPGGGCRARSSGKPLS